jgi:hypothetical protein
MGRFRSQAFALPVCVVLAGLMLLDHREAS